MDEQNRRSGRTHKCVVAALAAAAEGKAVLFFVGTNAMVDYVRNMAERISGAAIDRNGKSPAFSGTFRVACAQDPKKEEQLRRARDVVSFYDHFWPSL